MRAPIAISAAIQALAGAVLLACTASPKPAPPAPGGLMAGGRAAVFSAERAWSDLEALAAVGPRIPGSDGSERARAYIRQQLEALGLDVTARAVQISIGTEEKREFEIKNLQATIPGAESSDLIVLAAPYDSASADQVVYPGVNDGASGAALLLELARVLVQAPIPYSTRLYFLDGEAPVGRGSSDEGLVGLLGSAAEARALARGEEARRVRLLLLFNRVSDADLRIARDRLSHRTHRNSIWRAAAELGYDEFFPPASEFEAPHAGHHAFIESGVRPSVAIVDPHLGAAGAAGAAHTEDDTLARSSPRSLEVVGRVALAGIEDITAQLRKIDRYSQVPVRADPPAAEAPTAVEKPESDAQPDPEAAPLPVDDALPDDDPAPSPGQ
jgi:glutaminyl-peptide cyclotransferase